MNTNILLTDEQQRELRDWNDLFDNAGWARLQQWLEVRNEALDSAILDGQLDDNAIKALRGERSLVRVIRNWEDSIRTNYENLVDANQQVAEEDLESTGANA